MFSRSASKGLVFAVIMGILCIIAGCGGSGGGSSSSGTTIVVRSSKGNVHINNNSLSFSGTTPVSITLTKSDGTPAAGVSVTFTTTLGTLTVDGTGAGSTSVVVTADTTGTAKAYLTAGAISGQGQLSATASIDNQVVTSTGLFSVNLPTLQLTPLHFTNNSSATINYKSSQGITVDVTDSTGKPYTQPVDVVFTSTMAAQGKASINSPVTTVDGKATTTYTSLTGSGADTITASISGSSVNKVLTIKPLDAGAISFVSASPNSIGLSGMGGLGKQETSIVTFKVVDTSGAPKPNQAVTFSLSTNLGGLSLLFPSGSTDNNGNVYTVVQSGIVATPVRVIASTQVNGRALSTQSDLLVVSTGIPAQDSFSMAFSNLNSESFNHDGIKVGVTVRLSDHFHNPVPDGTAVYFTTTGGSISPSCVTTDGTCSVNWTSQEPRPDTGRIVVLAYAVGEEAFIDRNGSGYADYGEFTPDTVAFRDDNFDCTNPPAGKTVKQCAVAESLPWLDFDSNTWTSGATHTFPDPNPGYIGVLQGVDQNEHPYSANTPKLKHVFLNRQFVMSTDAATIKFTPTTTTMVTPADLTYPMQLVPAPEKPNPDFEITGGGNFQIFVSDLNGNTMASGTTIQVTAPFGKLSGDTNVTVPQNTSNAQVLSLLLSTTTSPTAHEKDLIVITVKSPGGLITTGYIPISGSF